MENKLVMSVDVHQVLFLSSTLPAGRNPDLFYIIDKSFPIDEKKKLLQLLLSRNEIISESKKDIASFISNNDWTDLEDGLQMQCAANYKLDYIITRNLDDFTTSAIPAISMESYLDLLKNR